jgi:Cu/Ag efflux pump CusA
MSFRISDPHRSRRAGVSLEDDSAYALKVHAEMAKLPFLRDLQYAQELNYPTLDITIDRERWTVWSEHGGRLRSIVPATSFVPFHPAELLARSSFREMPFRYSTVAAEPLAGRRRVGHDSVMQSARGETRLTDVADIKSGTMPGLIERYNGQRVVLAHRQHPRRDLGEASQQLNAALASAALRPKA